MPKVITYQSPNGETVNLSANQIRTLESGHNWPRDSRGEEFCSVSRGLHEGVACDWQWLMNNVNRQHD